MYRIEITAQARDDADAAYEWMAEHISPAFAERWYQGLFKEIETLRKSPTRCPIARESEKFPESIYVFTYVKIFHKNKYRVLFAIRGDIVTILYAYHTSRQELEP